jgi:RNA polymerase sigma factor (sigma-70 family)
MHRPNFATTRWSLVSSASQSAPERQRALGELCELYWYPLYAYVRRQGHPEADAQDLTQAFFAAFIERADIEKVDAERGKFRSFLMASMKHFLAKDWDRKQTLKRGGHLAVRSLDPASAEGRYQLEPVDGWTPERLFERRWACDVLVVALDRLQDEFVAKGREALFERLRPMLVADGETEPYEAIGREFEISEGAIKVTVHRMRRRFGELLQEEVAGTLGEDGSIEEELAWLRRAVADGGA